jgi:hypothetical protein
MRSVAAGFLKEEEMRKKMRRPVATESFTVERRSHCGELFITVTMSRNRPFEVFIRFGKAGGCSSAMADGLARLLSYGLRSGLSPQEAAKALSGISCHQGPRTCLNEVAVAIMLVLKHLETGVDLNALIEEKDFAEANYLIMQTA